MVTQKDQFLLELESLKQGNWKEQKQDLLKQWQIEKEYSIETFKNSLRTKWDDGIVIEKQNTYTNIHEIMEWLWVTEWWIIEKLKEWLEKAVKLDKKWNVIEDWEVKARILDMLAKMKWMYKNNNEQSKAVVNVVNAFQSHWKNLL